MQKYNISSKQLNKTQTICLALTLFKEKKAREVLAYSYLCTAIMATRQMKHRYLQGLGIIIIVLALVRCVFGGEKDNDRGDEATELLSNENGSSADSILAPTASEEAVPRTLVPPSNPSPRPSRSAFIDYGVAFNDSNHVQLVAAQKWGVPPVKDREDAEQRKQELVYMACSPYYDMARLDASIPYLVPRAAILLQDIGMAFTDSLLARNMPLYRMVVSSVLRSEADVVRLRRTNKNATEQSCHLYGTTFDINYTTFHPVGNAREVDADLEIRLKNILGQVLYDLRSQGRCYVKYERVQPCFHITVSL